MSENTGIARKDWHRTVFSGVAGPSGGADV